MSRPIRTFVAVATLTVTSLLAIGTPQRAFCSDSFNRAEIQGAIKDYYDFFAGRAKLSEQFDHETRMRLTRVMARQLLSFDANIFNDVVGHMLAIDYIQSPADRTAIETLTYEIEAEGSRQRILETGKEARENGVLNAISDAVLVWGVIAAWGYGKAWIAADDLQGLERFTYAMKAGADELPAALQSRLARAGLSLAIGSTIAAYEYLYRTRLDPNETLQRVKDQVVLGLAEKAALFRKTLQTGSRTKEGVKTLEATQQELASMEDQVLTLEQNDPELRGRLSPIAEDISASQGELERLSSRH